MAAELTVLEASSSYVFATWRDVFIVIWRHTPRVATVMRLGSLVEKLAARHRKGISFFIVAEPGCGLPDGPTRELLARDVKRHDAFTRQIAMVYEGTGFSAAAMRSVVTTIGMFSKQNATMKMCAYVDEGATWLADGSTLIAADLGHAVRSARAAAEVKA